MDISDIVKFESPTYTELKTELQICKIGGLFLALYQDENIIDLIISYLKRDLPGQFVFLLEMNPQKIGFPTFFEQTFEQAGKKNNIFHVIGIEKFSQELQANFINYLQYTRERFKAKPYSIVFWISPHFEKQLFFSAPDFYHWISGVYDFSDIQVDVELFAEGLWDEEIYRAWSVSLENIVIFLEKVVWQYEHWQEVKEKGEGFLIEVMERANLYEYYISTYCIDKSGEERLLDDVLEEFLADNTKHFLTLLGDFGTGKSSFSLHHFIHLAKKYLQNGKGRIPIFILLKNYSGKINIEDFIVREFYEKYNIELTFNVFQQLALQGRFVFFVDGFDEMTSLSDQKLTEENFKELTKLSFENILFMIKSGKRSRKANKVFLTCRTHYFFTEVQEKNILKSSYTVLYRDYATKTNYEVTRIKLKEFNDRQIEEYIFKNTRDEATTRNILGIIKDIYNLKELSTRPILLDMIVKTLPSLEHQKEINAFNLYKAYTELWIDRDDWRSRMRSEGKRAFMWELALKMFNEGGDFSLHYSALNKPKREYLKQDVQLKKDEDDYYEYETTTCTFLNRDATGNYKFSHKSFMEYFLAEYYFYQIKNREKRILESFRLNKETEFFLKLIISSEKSNLRNLDLHNLNLVEVNLKGANLRGTNLSGTNLRGTNFSNANLSRVNFSKANLSGQDLSDKDLSTANLSEANLSRANLSGQDLSDKDLSGANLSEANLSGANLSGANLSRANLKDTILIGTEFKGADLSYTDLNSKDFRKANFSEANLRGANFSGANLREADLSEANLEHAILIETELYGANLSHTNLRGRDLSGKDLRKTNLSRANLKDTILIGTEFKGADLSYTVLSGKDLSNKDLGEVNFSGANLSGTNLSGTNLNGADLRNANFSYADLRGANLDHAHHRDSANFDHAIFDKEKQDQITTEKKDNGQEEQS